MTAAALLRAAVDLATALLMAALCGKALSMPTDLVSDGAAHGKARQHQLSHHAPSVENHGASVGSLTHRLGVSECLLLPRLPNNRTQSVHPGKGSAD